MTLIIEDGTGKPDAESYASAEDLALYAVKFGIQGQVLSTRVAFGVRLAGAVLNDDR